MATSEDEKEKSELNKKQAGSVNDSDQTNDRGQLT